jgi:hypothetical protein
MAKLFIRFTLSYFFIVLIFALIPPLIEIMGGALPLEINELPPFIAAYILGRHYARRFNEIPDKDLSWKFALLSNAPVIVFHTLIFIFFEYPQSVIKSAILGWETYNYVLVWVAVLIARALIQTVIVRYMLRFVAMFTLWRIQKKKTPAIRRRKVLFKLLKRFSVYYIITTVIYTAAYVVIALNWFELPALASLATSFIAAGFLGRFYVRRYNKIPDKAICWKVAFLSNIPVIGIGILQFLYFLNGDLSPVVETAASIGVLNFVLLMGFFILLALALHTLIVRYTYAKSAELKKAKKKKKKKTATKAKTTKAKVTKAKVTKVKVTKAAKTKATKTKKRLPKKGASTGKKAAKGR